MGSDGTPMGEAGSRKETTRLRARVFRCPECDGWMSYDVWGGRLRCQSCGQEVDPSSADAKSLAPYATVTVSQATDTSDVAEPRHAETDSDFFSQIEWADGTDVPIRSAVMWECPSCSASVLTDAAATTSECPYCGTTMSVAEERMPVESSAKVIPFSVTGKEARKAIAKHLASRPWLPSGFSDDATLEHAKSVYVPYYRYGVSVRGWATYPIEDSVTRRGKRSVPRYHIARRTAEMDFVDVPADGSSKMPDAYMDALAPFPFDEAVPLSDAYLAGHLAEVPDETPSQLAARVAEAATRSFDAAMDASMTKGQPIGTRRSRWATNARMLSWSVTLVPVWVMRYSYDGEDVLVCVNGATGRCVSSLPIDVRKCGASRLLAVVPAVLVLGALVAAFMSGALSKSPEMSGRDWAELLPFMAILVLGLGFGIFATLREHDDAGDAAMDSSGTLRYVGRYADGRGLRVSETLHSTEKFTDRDRADEYSDRMLSRIG